jgi:hypothetical protein
MREVAALAGAAVRFMLAWPAQRICIVFAADVTHRVTTEAVVDRERDFVHHISWIRRLLVAAIEWPRSDVWVRTRQRHSKNLHHLEEEITRCIGGVHVHWLRPEA